MTVSPRRASASAICHQDPAEDCTPCTSNTLGPDRLIHCGDTIWHGGWYEIARRYAPFELAFLPINGVRVRLPGFTATDVPATLGPEQAIEAAVVLQTRAIVATHHGLFHNPPAYVEQPDAQARMHEAARRRQVDVLALGDGQLSTLAHVTAS